MTQKDLAPRAGITFGTLSLIERGEANPTWGTVSALAKALDVTMGALGKAVDQIERQR